MASLRMKFAFVAMIAVFGLWQMVMMFWRTTGRGPNDRDGKKKRWSGNDNLGEIINDRQVPSVYKPHSNGLPTIFVNIAAFRDVETNATLHSLFERANSPERVHVGLVCQMDPDQHNELCIQPGSWDDACGLNAWCPTDNILQRTFNAKHSKGPTYARYLASLLYRGEDYFMMIDSHNRFRKGWDDIILKEHAKTGKMKSVLSTYPMGINPKDENLEEPGVAYLCALGTNGDGWTAGFPGPYWANTFRESDYPKPQPYIGAGLVFGPGSMVCQKTLHLL